MSPAGESERSRIGILRAVAVLILAAALLFPGPAGAAVVIEGAPPWLRERMERSAASVWSEIRQDGSLSAGDSLRLLSLVAERVFAGFAVEDSFSGEMPSADQTPAARSLAVESSRPTCLS